MKKLIIATLAAIALAAPGIANAAPPPNLASGMKIVNSTGEACTVTAVGYDTYGNKVGLTAGHCATIGQEIKTNNVRVGTMATRRVDWTNPGTLQPDKYDYGFILLDNSVTMNDDLTNPVNIKSIVAPPPPYQFGNGVCKYGHSPYNVRETCGIVTKVAPIEFDHWATSSFGDSGGPVYTQGNKTKLAGITSRPTTIPYASPTVAQRADAAVADATAKGWVGSGFTPVA